MIACPECGLVTRSTEVRFTRSGARRRRKCPNGHAVTTLEMVVSAGTGNAIRDMVLVRSQSIRELRIIVEGLARMSAESEAP